MPKNSPEAKTYTIDLDDKVLGRVATEVANILRGKNCPNFCFNKLTAVKVVVFNANKIKFTGKKLDQKTYFRHSGVLGNLKSIKLRDLMEKDSSEVFKKAVRGMLPKNRLRKEWLKNLFIYPEEINE